ncbi:hypothetical protein [Streptomyces sp. YIM S03343]
MRMPRRRPMRLAPTRSTSNQEMLGHSSITITADTYTSLLPETYPAIAGAAVRLVPRAHATFEEPAPTAVSEPDGRKSPWGVQRRRSPRSG